MTTAHDYKVEVWLRSLLTVSDSVIVEIYKGWRIPPATSSVRRYLQRIALITLRKKNNSTCNRRASRAIRQLPDMINRFVQNMNSASAQRLFTRHSHSLPLPLYVNERGRGQPHKLHTHLCASFSCAGYNKASRHIYFTQRVASISRTLQYHKCTVQSSTIPQAKVHALCLSTFTTGIRLQAQSLEPGVLASDRFLTSNTTGYTHLVFTISSIRSSRIRVASGSSTPATRSTIGALLSSVATMLARAAPSTAQASDLWSWRVRVAFVPSATSPFDPCLGDGVTKSACCEPPEGGLKVLRDGDSAGRVLSLASPV